MNLNQLLFIERFPKLDLHGYDRETARVAIILLKIKWKWKMKSAVLFMALEVALFIVQLKKR